MADDLPTGNPYSSSCFMLYIYRRVALLAASSFIHPYIPALLRGGWAWVGGHLLLAS